MQVTIIGAGPGISNAVAKLFGGKGYKVGLISRNEEKLKNEVAQLKDIGIAALYAVADAGNETSLLTALNKIQEHYGYADMILYNAYMPSFRSLEQESWESIQAQV